MDNKNPTDLEAAEKKIARLEAQVDRLKEVLLQVAWELEHKHKYITEMEEEFLKNRRKG
jgi:molecular chaperone GrpE (heat shock protein)